MDSAYIVKMAAAKKVKWGGIWKSVKQIDKDANGFVTLEELEVIFKEHFPVELEGKSVHAYLKRFQSSNNKALIDYKQIKNDINSQIMVTSSPTATTLSVITSSQQCKTDDGGVSAFSDNSSSFNMRKGSNTNKYGDGIGKVLLNSRRIAAAGSDEDIAASNIIKGARGDRSITPVNNNYTDNNNNNKGYKINEAL